MRGVCADWTLIDYFRGMRIGISSVCGPDDVYAGNLAGGLEALAAGVTDRPRLLALPQLARARRRGAARDPGVRAAGDLRLRHVPGAAGEPRVRHRPRSASTTPGASAAGRSAGDEGTVRMGIALTELGLVPWEVTVGEVALARELDVMVTAHTGSVHAASPAPRGRADGGRRPAGRRPGPRALQRLHRPRARPARRPRRHRLGHARDRAADGDGVPGDRRARERSPAGRLRLRHRLQQQRRYVHADADGTSGRAGPGQPALDRRAARCPRSSRSGPATRCGWRPSAAPRRWASDRRPARSRPARPPTCSSSAPTASGSVPVNDPVATFVLQCSAADVDTVLVAGEPLKRDGALVGRATRPTASTLVGAVERPHPRGAGAARRPAAARARGLPRHDPGGDRDEPRRRTGGGGDERAARFVDLSAPIENSPEDLLEPLRTEIEFEDHAAGAALIEQLFGVPPRLLRTARAGPTTPSRRFGTHNSTHVDAPWHYNSTINGEPAQRIDELPLEWFFAPRRRARLHRQGGRRRGHRRRGRGRARARRPRPAAARHRPRAHRPRRVLRPARLHGARPGRHRARRPNGSTSAASA